MRGVSAGPPPQSLPAGGEDDFVPCLAFLHHIPILALIHTRTNTRTQARTSTSAQTRARPRSRSHPSVDYQDSLSSSWIILYPHSPHFLVWRRWRLGWIVFQGQGRSGEPSDFWPPTGEKKKLEYWEAKRRMRRPLLPCDDGLSSGRSFASINFQDAPRRSAAHPLHPLYCYLAKNRGASTALTRSPSPSHHVRGPSLPPQYTRVSLVCRYVQTISDL